MTSPQRSTAAQRPRSRPGGGSGGDGGAGVREAQRRSAIDLEVGRRRDHIWVDAYAAEFQSALDSWPSGKPYDVAAYHQVDAAACRWADRAVERAALRLAVLRMRLELGALLAGLVARLRGAR